MGKSVGRERALPSVFGEFPVGDRRGRHRIHGPLERIPRIERVVDDSYQIAQRDPAHILIPAADHAASAHFEREQHFGQRAAVGAEHNSDAQVHRTHARVRRGPRGLLPGEARLRQEVVARRTLLVRISSPRLP